MKLHRQVVTNQNFPLNLLIAICKTRHQWIPGVQAKSKIASQLEHQCLRCNIAGVSGDKYGWPILSQPSLCLTLTGRLLTMSLGRKSRPPLSFSHLCCSFPLYIYVFLSLHLSLLFPHTSNTFLIGCRSANSSTWPNGLVLSVSRQMGCSCSGYFSVHKKEKEACV